MDHLRVIAVALLIATLAAPAWAARLRSFQSGQTTLAGASTMVTLRDIDLSRSFLVFGAALDGNEPQHAQVAGRLSSSTSITFTRFAAGGSVTLNWYVAEFARGVSVQRGQATFTNGDPCTSPCSPLATQNATLASSVDTLKSFPLISYYVDGTNFDRNDLVRARLTSSTNLELSMSDTVNNGFVEWQVVEYPDADVQSGTVSFASGDSSQTATVASVDTTKSWLVYSYLSPTGTTANIGQKLVRGRVTNSTTLTFDRDRTGQTIDLAWQLVEFTDETTVLHGSEPFTSGELQRNVAIPGIDLARSLAVGGMYGRGGKSPYQSDDNPGVGWFALALTSATNLRLTRGVTGTATADLGWFVVSFAQRRVSRFH